MNNSYEKESSKVYKPTVKKEYTQKKIIKISNDQQSPDLEVSFQQFNPSTSPPINNFMDRLMARNLTY